MNGLMVPDLTQRLNAAGERDANRSHGSVRLTGRIALQPRERIDLCECVQPVQPRTSGYPERWCSPGCAADYLWRHVRDAS